jgi:hypothetical protein
VPNLEVYDPKLDRWDTRSPMPPARGGLAATSLNGKLYVFGGEQWVPEQKVFAESWVYHPETDVWEALPPLPTPRHGLGASAVGNRIFVFGGGTLCYQKWRDKEKTIYEPLVWYIDAVKICSIHHQRLLCECPQCHRQYYPSTDTTVLSGYLAPGDSFAISTPNSLSEQTYLSSLA